MIKQEQKKNKIFRLRSRQAGFSLLELIIAIFILTIGITAALQLIVSTIRNSMDTRNAVVASALAQEGLEIVRNIRDNNMLLQMADRSVTVSFKSNGFPQSNSNCIFSYNSSGSICPATSNNAKLYIDGNGFYTHSGLTETAFKRYVNFVYESDPPTGVNVTSRVWWGNGDAPASCNAANKCVEVQSYLPKRD